MGAIGSEYVGIFGLDGNEAWAVATVLVTDDGVHGGPVGEVVVYVGMEVFEYYFGHFVDWYQREDSLYYLCHDVCLSFLHLLYEWAEEVECHGLAGEEVVEEAIFFDGFVLLFVGYSCLGILVREGCEEVLACLFTILYHADLLLLGSTEWTDSHLFAYGFSVATL